MFELFFFCMGLWSALQFYKVIVSSAAPVKECALKQKHTKLLRKAKHSSDTTADDSPQLAVKKGDLDGMPCQLHKDALQTPTLIRNSAFQVVTKEHIPVKSCDNWVQCDACGKWRMLLDDVNPASLPKRW